MEIFAINIQGCSCQHLKQDTLLLAKHEGFEIIGDGNFFIVHLDSKKIFGVDSVNIKMPILNGNDNRKDFENLLMGLN